MNSERITIRISPHMIDELDALSKEMAQHIEYSTTGNMLRSECLRLCALKGMELIKRELEEKKT